MTPGDLIGGKYRLSRPIGRGAMGEVWAAVNDDTDRDVALKLITTPDPEMLRRLKREARAIGRLDHPNIVQILDRGETTEGLPFLVMQLLQGETLGQRLRKGPLPQPVAAGIALDVARALRIAHEKQIIHRDLKPANIILHREPDTEDEIVKVVDFGVSKIVLDHDGSTTAQGNLVGSPAYMSPEQMRGLSVDGRSDLWSLGVMLFEMLAGTRPFTSDQPVVLLSQILTAPIPRIESAVSGIDPGLGDVIAACLTRELDQRIPSAADLVQRLRPFAPRARFATMSDAEARARFASIPDMPAVTLGAVASAALPEPPPSSKPAAPPPPVPAQAAASNLGTESEGPTTVFKPSDLLGAVAAAAQEVSDPEVATAVMSRSVVEAIEAAHAQVQVQDESSIDATTAPMPRMPAPGAPVPKRFNTTQPLDPRHAENARPEHDTDFDATVPIGARRLADIIHTTQPLDPRLKLPSPAAAANPPAVALPAPPAPARPAQAPQVRSIQWPLVMLSFGVVTLLGALAALIVTLHDGNRAPAAPAESTATSASAGSAPAAAKASTPGP